MDVHTESHGPMTSPSTKPFSRRHPPCPPDDGIFIIDFGGIRHASPPHDGRVSMLEMVPSPSCGIMDDLRRSLSPFSGRPPLGGGIP